MNDLDATMSALAREVDPFRPAAPRVVQRQDGTTATSAYAASPDAQPFAGDADAGIDGLFGASVGYQAVKRERPIHRLILWATLNGHKPKEIAGMFNVTYQTVLTTQKQPWFQEAFCRISTEMGRDSVETFLEGQVLPTLQKLVELRDGEGVPAAVQKSACDAILDRIRGKPTVHVKQETNGTIDHVVHDAAALMEEQKRNAEILKARGVGAN